MLETPPEEPIDQRRILRSIEPRMRLRLACLSDGVPSQFWQAWRADLRASGVSWNMFLRAMRQCRVAVARWADGDETWAAVVDSARTVALQAAKERNG